MNNTHNRNTIWGTGLAVIAVAFAASARPASALTPLLPHPAQVQQAFDGWGHDNNWNHDDSRNHDGDQGRDYGRDRERRVEQERLRVERERRLEQERRDAERARHEAEVRHEQWLREHRHDGDRDRHDFYGGWRHDDRG